MILRKQHHHSERDHLYTVRFKKICFHIAMAPAYSLVMHLPRLNSELLKKGRSLRKRSKLLSKNTIVLTFLGKWSCIFSCPSLSLNRHYSLKLWYAVSFKLTQSFFFTQLINQTKFISKKKHVCSIDFGFFYFWKPSSRTTIKLILFFHKVSLSFLVSYHNKLLDQVGKLDNHFWCIKNVTGYI